MSGAMKLIVSLGFAVAAILSTVAATSPTQVESAESNLSLPVTPVVLVPTCCAPMCGSDGASYTNECELGIASCNHPDQNIAKVLDEACPSPPPEIELRKLAFAPAVTCSAPK